MLPVCKHLPIPSLVNPVPIVPPQLPKPLVTVFPWIQLPALMLKTNFWRAGAPTGPVCQPWLGTNPQRAPGDRQDRSRGGMGSTQRPEHALSRIRPRTEAKRVLPTCIVGMLPWRTPPWAGACAGNCRPAHAASTGETWDLVTDRRTRGRAEKQIYGGQSVLPERKGSWTSGCLKASPSG